MAPVPDIIEEAPYDIFVAIHDLLLRPEIPGAEPWIFFKIAHNLHKVGLQLGYVSFRRISVNTFDNLHPAIQSID